MHFSCRCRSMIGFELKIVFENQRALESLSLSILLKCHFSPKKSAFKAKNRLLKTHFGSLGTPTSPKTFSQRKTQELSHELLVGNLLLLVSVVPFDRGRLCVPLSLVRSDSFTGGKRIPTHQWTLHHPRSRPHPCYHIFCFFLAKIWKPKIKQ